MTKNMTKAQMAELVEMAKVVVDAVYHKTTAQEILCDDVARGWGDDPTDSTGIIRWADARIARLGDTTEWYPIEILSAIIGRTGSEDIVAFRTAILAVLMARPLTNARNRIEWAEFSRPSHTEVFSVWKRAKKALSHTRRRGHVSLTCSEGIWEEDGYSSYQFWF